MSFPGSCARYVHTRFESLQGEDDQPKTYLFSIYTDISDAMGALSIRVETLQTVMEWEENQFTAVSLMTKTLTLLTVELVRDVIPCDVLATVCTGGTQPSNLLQRYRYPFYGQCWTQHKRKSM